MTLTTFGTVAFLRLMAALSPNRTVLIAARTGITEGMRRAAFLAVEKGLVGVFLAMTALFVLALVFQADPGIFWSPKVLGGVYIAQLGWRMWRDAATPPDKRPSCRLPRGAASTLRLGAKTQLANLALAVLFSAILIGTVPPNTPLSVYVALLAVVFLNEMLRNVIVARIFSFDSTRRGYISLKTVLDRAFGDLLAIISVKIAAT